ncbi:acylphosphatase [Pararhizobium sp. O133]|uniref:acylphosphatase n=1 Tax=Pararhizobium sp. O133 TaxID=3449278 RepID=UPI003F68367A
MGPQQNHRQERMTILGDLDGPSFVPWIRRHAAKLGLSQAIAHAGPDRIELDVAGAVELIDMMEVGCLLGPIDVWIETINRTPVGDENNARPERAL